MREKIINVALIQMSVFSVAHSTPLDMGGAMGQVPLTSTVVMPNGYFNHELVSIKLKENP